VELSSAIHGGLHIDGENSIDVSADNRWTTLPSWMIRASHYPYGPARAAG
jgi:hypothetical protein